MATAMKTQSFVGGRKSGCKTELSSEPVPTGLPDLRTRTAIQDYIRGVAQQLGVEEDDEAVAVELDRRDCLAPFRDSFHVPSVGQLLSGTKTDPGIFDVLFVTSSSLPRLRWQPHDCRYIRVASIACVHDKIVPLQKQTNFSASSCIASIAGVLKQ